MQKSKWTGDWSCLENGSSGSHRRRMLLIILASTGNGEAGDCVELGMLAQVPPLREGGVLWYHVGLPRSRVQPQGAGNP